MEKTIIVHHEISVDECILDEVEELNNRYGVVTIHTCCGHGNKKQAFISVRLNSIEKMLLLGYDKKPKHYLLHDTFTPKSKCKCKSTQKCSKCGKVRRGWNKNPFLCYNCHFDPLKVD